MNNNKNQRRREKRPRSEPEREARIQTWKLPQREIFVFKETTTKRKKERKLDTGGAGWQQGEPSGKGTCLQTEVRGCGGQFAGHVV